MGFFRWIAVALASFLMFGVLALSCVLFTGHADDPAFMYPAFGMLGLSGLIIFIAIFRLLWIADPTKDYR